MNITQSCWFQNPSKLESGWLSVQYNLMSWALSALSYSKFYPNLTLIADIIGADILIDKLALPYKNISLAQEHYKTEFESLWVLRKLYSYSIQNEPFIHADGDSYLFKSFDDEIFNSPLIGQNMEYDHPCYVAGYDEVMAKCKYLPNYIKRDNDNSLSAVNAGIIGGNDVGFFKYLFSEVNEFINRNSKIISEMESFTFNIFLEQFIFKKLADKKGLKIAYQVKKPIGYPYVYNLFGFVNLPSYCPYIHVMNYKQNPTICEQMAQRLYIENPELYERVIRVANELVATKVFIEKPVEKNFIEKHFYRSAIIAMQLGLKLPVLETEIEVTITKWVSQLSDEIENKILKDAFQYELDKYNFIKELPTEEVFINYRKEQSIKVNNVLSLREESNLIQNITFGKHISNIESEWKWAEKNEFTGQDSSIDYLDNLKLEPSYFQVLLFCYPVSMTVKEQLLDTISIFIIDAIQQIENLTISINQLIENVVQAIISINPENDFNILKNSILDKVRYLLYQGVLCFVC